MSDISQDHAERFHVGLFFGTSGTIDRQPVCDGIARFAGEIACWQVQAFTGGMAGNLTGKQLLRNFGGDGALTQTRDPGDMDALVANGLPAVAVVKKYDDPPISSIEHDWPAVAAAALEHLTESGYRRIGFFGSGHNRATGNRLIEAMRNATDSGSVESFFLGPRSRRRWTLEKQLLDLADWLSDFSEPVGVLAWNDDHAQRLLRACDLAGLTVPDDVGIVGIGNRRMTCEFSHPTLSSIALDDELLGYRAAALLHQHMTGRAREPVHLKIPPRGVIVRASSTHGASGDPIVDHAIALMRDELGDGVTIERVAGRLGVSRRTLDRHFQRQNARSAYAYLKRLQLLQIKRLLLETRLPLADIAVRCDIDHISQLSRWVKQDTGLTPTQYRDRPMRG